MSANIQKEDLTKLLEKLVDYKMRIWIQDQAEDAEPQQAPMVERHLAKWELCEEGEHIRLFFNQCQFLAIPITAGHITLEEKPQEILLTTEDRKGKLLYTLSFLT